MRGELKAVARARHTLAGVVEQAIEQVHAPPDSDARDEDDCPGETE
jgi:hypothetical protein